MIELLPSIGYVICGFVAAAVIYSLGYVAGERKEKERCLKKAYDLERSQGG